MGLFGRSAEKLKNWLDGSSQDSGKVVTLNSPSFLEALGLKKGKKPTS